MNNLLKTGMIVCLAGAMMAAATGCGNSNNAGKEILMKLDFICGFRK